MPGRLPSWVCWKMTEWDNMCPHSIQVCWPHYLQWCVHLLTPNSRLFTRCQIWGLSLVLHAHNSTQSHSRGLRMIWYRYCKLSRKIYSQMLEGNSNSIEGTSILHTWKLKSCIPLPVWLGNTCALPTVRYSRKWWFSDYMMTAISCTCWYFSTGTITIGALCVSLLVTIHT